ncbi:MAG: hypothetical protein ACO1QS_03010 [Verrucomicrobiota bacterium]
MAHETRTIRMAKYRGTELVGRLRSGFASFASIPPPNQKLSTM